MDRGGLMLHVMTQKKYISLVNFPHVSSCILERALLHVNIFLTAHVIKLYVACQVQVMPKLPC